MITVPEYMRSYIDTVLFPLCKELSSTMVLHKKHSFIHTCTNRDNPNEHRTRAMRMITDPEYTRSYIDTVLTPLVKDLSSTMEKHRASQGSASIPYSAAILAYDILNEPEGTSWDLRLYSNYK